VDLDHDAMFAADGERSRPPDGRHFGEHFFVVQRTLMLIDMPFRAWKNTGSTACGKSRFSMPSP